MSNNKLIWTNGTINGYDAVRECDNYRREGYTIPTTDQQVGQLYYVTEVTTYNNGVTTRHTMSDRPCHTNMSRMPRLNGWCGETDNVSRTAIGIWEVVRCAKNGRVQLREVTDADRITAYLDETGCPELLPEVA